MIIVGGGPAGLSAALALGRACKRVLVCDAGPRRNAAAEQIHNFVTRDGTAPDEFRRIAHEQLAAYPQVEVRALRVEAVAGREGAFAVTTEAGILAARRLLLCTGMIDETLAIEGFAAHWGRSVVQCPYCHGWELRDRPWGFLVPPEHADHVVPFALQLRGWTREVSVFTNGTPLADEARAGLDGAGVRVVEAELARLLGDADGLEAIELVDGSRVACALLFAHPPQRQTALVDALALALDDEGYVRVDPHTRATSVPGIHAAGDLTTRMQSALAAAAAGQHAAAVINLALTS